MLVVKNMNVALIDLDNVAVFEVHDVERENMWYGKWIGAVRPVLKWDTSAEQAQ
jgi:lipopolysaccharide transport system ATP-binding protein